MVGKTYESTEKQTQVMYQTYNILNPILRASREVVAQRNAAVVNGIFGVFLPAGDLSNQQADECNLAHNPGLQRVRFIIGGTERPITGPIEVNPTTQPRVLRDFYSAVRGGFSDGHAVINKAGEKDNALASLFGFGVNLRAPIDLQKQPLQIELITAAGDALADRKALFLFTRTPVSISI